MANYTLKDLKEGKVILKNNSNKITKQILKKAFNETMKSYEMPGDLYYFANKSGYNGLGAFSSIKIIGNLCSDGEMRVPDYLKGYTSNLQYYNIEDLPIQNATKFKL
jgi:hypothetical protein